MSAGSFCRSPSEVTTISPRDVVEACGERRGLAEIPPQAYDPEPRITPASASIRSPVPSLRAVVHEDDLEGTAHGLEGSRQLRRGGRRRCRPR